MTSPGVHIGLDGWLFLVGGTNHPVRLYRRDLRSWWRLRGWQHLIESRRARCLERGVTYLHAVVPEKLSVYADAAPELGLDPARSPTHLLAERFRGDPLFVDLLPPLLAGKAAARLYRRLDSHWTHEGCLVAHDAICRALGIAPAPDLADRPFHESEQPGDLGAKLEPVRTETVRHHAIHRDARRVSANALVLRAEAEGWAEELHRGAETVYRNDVATAAPLRVVLFGDSCAHWAPFLLTGMLAESVRELHFVWSASLDWSYVARVRPDVVVGEIAERFLARVPDDRFDLEAFVRRRLGAS